MTISLPRMAEIIVMRLVFSVFAPRTTRLILAFNIFSLRSHFLHFFSFRAGTGIESGAYIPGKGEVEKVDRVNSNKNK